MAFSHLMNPPVDQCLPLGSHFVHIDGDTIVVIAHKVVTLDDMHRLLDYFKQIRREHGLLFVIYDGREATGIDPAARKLVTHERSMETDSDLRVAFGLPFTLRVMVNMIIHARKILRNHDVSMYVFDKEHEAWAFFEKERERIRNQARIKRS